MIALKINSREIEERELREEWEAVERAIDNDPSSPTLNKSLTLRYAKENIVNRVILEEEAELMVDEIDFKLIQEEYDKLVAHYGGWEKIADRFQQVDKQISPHQIKLNIEKSLKVNRLLEIWTEDIALPNEGEMMSHYEHHRELFMSPQQILFSKFSLPHEPSPQNNILMEGLVRYQERQKDYSDFLNKAQQIPHLDYQEKFYLIPGQIHPQVEEVLMGLEDEQISGIIQTEEGYSLFKRWAIIPPKELEYDQVRERIEKILFEKKRQKRIRESLNQLRKQTVVQDHFPDPEQG